jgi:hypothetical protein
VSRIDEQGGVITLTGRVASEAQRVNIHQGLRSLDRGLQLRGPFEVIAWPFCEVLDLLEPFQQRNEDQALGLIARLDKPGDPPLYAHMENIRVIVKVPTKFDSYVYVDYYSTTEAVAHLFPNPLEASNRLAASSTYTVGELKGPQEWVILPPFGRDLVTVIASKTPLFSQARPEEESARAYLQDLRQALSRDASTADIAAAFYFIQTQDRP